MRSALDELRLQAAAPFERVAGGALGLRPVRLLRGEVGLRARHRLLALRQGGLGRGEPFPRRDGDRHRARILRRERPPLRPQALEHTLRVGEKRHFAGDVVARLGDPPVELGASRGGAAFFGIEGVVGEGDAVQPGGRGGLGVAQRRHLMGGDSGAAGGLRLRARALRDVPQVALELCLGLDDLAARILEGDVEEQGLRASDLARQAAVADRLPCLALEALELGLDLAEHVFQPLEIVLGRVEPSSASWRREWRPEMPAASSRIRRRAWGLAAMSSAICPCRTKAGERAPVEASAKMSWTSRARTSRPLMR